jgi:arylsulfatase A-like enzyme
MSRAFRDDLGYTTAIIGKNHFGMNKTAHTVVKHGFEHCEMTDSPSDYAKWFHNKEGNKPFFPPGTDYNTWWADPFKYPYNEHSTAWIGMRSKYYIENYDFSKPLFLKSSFFSPHSPYDCPTHYVDMVDESKMAPIIKGADWDKKY